MNTTDPGTQGPRETVTKSLGAMALLEVGFLKLPGVENLPTVIVRSEMHVFPITLRSTT